TRSTGVAVVAAVVVLAAAAGLLLSGLLDRDAVANWATVFVAITLQAVPFLVLGVTISAAIAAYVSPTLLPRLLPSRAQVAVPVAALAGALLPGCECGSVPIARRLIDRGAPAAAALAFLLAAPAINPVVLVATAVAFPGRPEMVAARFLASLLASVVVGWCWLRIGRGDLLTSRRRSHEHEGTRREVLLATASHDFLSAGGFLIVGAATAATLQTVVPRSVLDNLAGSGALALLALGVLAVVMAICSEADAFVAASLRQFSASAQLAFMVVGPMVDVKLIALQAGTFGRAFAMRFAPLTFVAALGSAALVGWWLL
ncbi:MAG: permease, partial [Pseudonocardiales bacterium]